MNLYGTYAALRLAAGIRANMIISHLGDTFSPADLLGQPSLHEYFHNAEGLTMRSTTSRNVSRTPTAVFADDSTNMHPIFAANAAPSASDTRRMCLYMEKKKQKSEIVKDS